MFKVILLVSFGFVFILSFVGGVVAGLLAGNSTASIVIASVFSALSGFVLLKTFKWKPKPQGKTDDALSHIPVVDDVPESEVKPHAPVRPSKEQRKALKAKYKRSSRYTSARSLSHKEKPSSEWSDDEWDDYLDDKPKKRRKAKSKPKRKCDWGTVEFTYMDADYNTTDRVVRVSSEDDVYFYGHCHLRKEYRQFKKDRVIGSLVNVETGEVLESV